MLKKRNYLLMHTYILMETTSKYDIVQKKCFKNVLTKFIILREKNY